MKALITIIVSLAGLLPCCFGQIEPASRVGLNEQNPSFADFNEFFACKRLFTNTGSRGCGSERDPVGSRGKLFGIDSAQDLQSFQDNKNLVDRAIVLANELFTASTVSDLVATKRVSVLLVKRQANPPASYNPDPPTSFNDGDGLSELALDFPVALLSEKETTLIESRVEENKALGYESDLWQHAAEYKFYNGQVSATSVQCLDLQRCDPLGGYSVWGTMGDSPSGEKESILLTTQMDSTAFFHDLAFGANSAASGIIAVLGAVHALGIHRGNISLLDKQIMVSLFQGETYDQVGSRRFVHDIDNGCSKAQGDSCSEPAIYSLAWSNLNLTKIKDVIAVDQVANYFSDISTFFTHVPANNVASDDLETELQTQASNAGAAAVKGDLLPPSPLDSFLANSKFSGGGVVFSGYNATYQEINPFYRSRFEQASVNSSVKLTEVATAIARTAFVRASEGQSPSITAADIQADQQVISDLEFCFTQNFACPLVAEYLDISLDEAKLLQEVDVSTNRLPQTPLPATFYTGVYVPKKIFNNIAPKMVERFIRNFVAHNSKPLNQTTGNFPCVSDTKCLEYANSMTCDVDFKTDLSCVRGQCICSSTHFHDAYSPALKIEVDENGNNIFSVLDKSDRLFTEPRYILPTLKIFQEAGNQTAISMLVSGLVLSLITALVTIKVAIPILSSTKFKLD